MSVVGPRPIVEEELAAYGDAADELLSAKPGITGWWQVQARNDATYGDGSRQELELWVPFCVQIVIVPAWRAAVLHFRADTT